MDRKGFTLVEVLVVIIIISLIAGMLVPAVVAARNKVNRAVATMEVYQLDFAVKAFKEKFGEYPPDFADADREHAMQQVKRFIARAFPRCTALPKDFRGTNLPAQYNAGTALVFWLGGRYDPDEGKWTGFSANPANPFDVKGSDGEPLTTPSASRIKPFCDFLFGPRITPTTVSGSPTVYSFWPKKVDPVAGGAGYVYFRSENGDYSTKCWAMPGAPDTATPITFGAAYDGTKTLAKKFWLNAASFQVRCCGLDGMMRTYTDPPANTATAWFAGVGLYPGMSGMPDVFAENRDDLSNCWDGQLEDVVQ